MADPQPQTLFQVLGPDGTVRGATTGDGWLAPDETLGPQIDTTTGKPPTSFPSLQPKGSQKDAVAAPAIMAPPPAATAAVTPPAPAAPSAPVAAAVPPVPAPPPAGTSRPAMSATTGPLSAIIPSAQAADIDFSKFGMTPSGGAPPGAQPPAKEAPKGGVDFSQFGMTPAPVPPPQTRATGPATQAEGYGLLSSPTPEATPWTAADYPGSLAAIIAGFGRGAIGGAITDYGDAAMQTIPRMFYGNLPPSSPFAPPQQGFRLAGPGQAFSEGLQAAQQRAQELQQAYPATTTAGELTGALGSGLVMGGAPALAWRGAPTMLGRAGNLASYLAANAALGAGTSAANYGDPGTGAALGALLPGLHAAAYGTTRPFSLAYQQLRPLWSQGARDVSLGDQLAAQVGTSPIQTSPVGPLDLAQATNNPTVAAATDIAPTYNPQAVNALRQQQQAAVSNQLGQIAPATTVADASTQGTQAVRNLEGFVNQREGELWSHPALTDFKLPTDRVQQGAQAGLNGVARNDPGLLGIGMTPQIRSALDGINGLPGRANLRNINSYISVLKAIQRRPPPDNPSAGALAGRLLDEVLPSLDDTVNSSGAPVKFQTAYAAARDFTRRSHEILGTRNMRTLLATTPEGVFSDRPSTALDKFFQFSRGSGEGADNFRQLQDFADEIRQAWLGQGDKFLQLTMARNDLRDGVRGYVAQSLRDIAEGGKTTAQRDAQAFLQKNRPWMVSSGLFTPGQIDAADKLSDYLAMLRRPTLLQHQVNSATMRRLVNDKTFVGQIVSPWITRLPAIAGGTYGLLGGHPIEALELLGGGGLAGEAANRYVEHVQGVMRQAMAEALMDPQKAQALMMTASKANRAFLPPNINAWLNRLENAVGTRVLPTGQAPGVPQLNVGQGAAAPAGAP